MLLLAIGALFWSLQTPVSLETETAALAPAVAGLEKPAERRSAPPPLVAEPKPRITQRGSMPAPFATPAPPAFGPGDILSPNDYAALKQTLTAAAEARDQLLRISSAGNAAARTAALEQYWQKVLQFGPVAYAELFQDPTLGPVLRRLVQTPQELDAFRRAMAKVANAAQVELPIMRTGTLEELIPLAEHLSATVRAERGGRIGGDLPPQEAAQAALMARASILGEAMERYGRARGLKFDPQQEKFVPRPEGDKIGGVKLIRPTEPR